MRFLVLGPLEVIGERGEPVPIAGSKERLILADLIARAGRVVSVDDLIDDVWGDRPPRTAEKTLGSHVSRLRRVLEPARPEGSTTDVIATRGGGYLLEIDANQIDSVRFERLAEEGRRHLDAGRPREAGAALEQALGLWRGTAYQEYRYTGFGSAEAERLEELRRSAAEDRTDTRLAFGVTAALIADLEAMVRDEPLRERRRGQLMLALYRAGRQAEALRAFDRARRVLADELGIDPGPDLRRLHAAILSQDSMLEGDRSGALTGLLRATDVCPYKGLARFEASDAEFFCGREQLVAEAVGRLVDGRFLAFIGPSGSGKSSLLRAGLMFTLRSGAIPGSERWSYAVMRPGEHPLGSLAEALDRSLVSGEDLPALGALPTGPGRVLLVIDQFEETFTVCTDVTERSAFLDAITEDARAPDGRVTVVLAMRADQYGRCAEHDALASLVATDQMLIGSMKADELRRAIELPAARAGLTIEARLSDALIEHTVNRPGGLPLLSTALLELWTHRRDRSLRLDDHLRTGGVEGAVARMAEDAFGRLDRAGQAGAKRILLRLAGSGEGDEVLGRSALIGELELERDASMSRALAALTEARLVMVAEGTVEVAHEALLRDWPRLRGWLEDDAEGRRLHRHVTGSARAWDEGGLDEGDLYRGARLTAALDWAEGHDPDLNALEREYLARSRAASEGEAVRARRANRRTRGLLVGVAVLLVLSLIVGNLALRQRDAARAAADVADARQLAAASIAANDTIVSLLLARAAVELDDSAQARSALLAALQRDPAAIAVMHATGAAPGDLTEWLALSPDGRVIATGGARTTVSLFDATAHEPIGVIDVGATTTAGGFSADGGTLVVAADDRRIVGIDVDAGTVRTRVDTEGGDVDAVLFEPQGGSLITAESSQGRGSLVARDPSTLEPSDTPVLSESGPITAMAASADGRWLVTTTLPPEPGPRETVLWDSRALEPVRSFPGVAGNDVALSPDGRVAAIAVAAGADQTQDDDLKGHLLLLDLRTGATKLSREGRAPGREGPAIGLTGVTFSADGRSVISTGDDHRVLVWGASDATIQQAHDDPSGVDTLTSVLSPDGATVFTIDVDGNVVVWDLAGDRRLGRPFTAGSGATGPGFDFPWFAISPDGSALAIVQAASFLGPGSVRVVDASTLQQISLIPYHRYADHIPEGVAFSPDGAILAVTSLDGYVQLWDVRTGEPIRARFEAPGTQGEDFWAAAFSPDGRTLATAGANWPTSDNPGDVVLWNVATGQLVGRLPELPHPVSAVNFSPDGTRIVASAGFPGPGDVMVWNVDEGRVERRIPADDSGVEWFDISNDGATLVTTGGSGHERRWDLSTGRPIGPALIGPHYTVDLSPDGRNLVAAGTGRILLWDVATGMVLGQGFPGPGPHDALGAAFSPDGRRLFIISTTGEGWVWDVDPASWERRACQIAGRDLTQAEWRLYLPDRPYRSTCGS